MQIHLNKQFNFSIRAYVAEIRTRDPKKCWPFGSLGAPKNNNVFASYQSAEFTFLSTQNCPVIINDSDDTQEHIEAQNSPEVEIINGQEDQPETNTDMIESIEINNDMGTVIHNGSSGSTSSKVNNGQYRHKNSVNKGPKIGDSTAADDIEPKGKKPQIKPRKFRLLSDIHNGPASESRPDHDITNLVNFNSKSVTETEDDSNDDITLNELVRKLKRVKGTNSTLKKNKKKKIQIEEPRVDQDKKSKHGPKVHSRKRTRIDDTDKQIITKGKKDCELPCNQKINQTEPTETANEDSEMEAVILLACRFNKVNFVNKTTATKCSLVYADTHKKVTKEKIENVFNTVQRNDHSNGTIADVFPPQLGNCETLVCPVNRNPADFSILNDENEFMRGV